MPTVDSRNFVGRWIGQTIGPISAAHVWEILDRGLHLEIRTRWEGQGQAHTLRAKPIDVEHFEIHGLEAIFTATLVDPLHFVIPGWDTNDTRGFDGPAFDVVFARPGLAELMSRQVWEQTRTRLTPARPAPNPPGLKFLERNSRRKRQ